MTLERGRTKNPKSACTTTLHPLDPYIVVKPSNIPNLCFEPLNRGGAATLFYERLLCCGRRGETRVACSRGTRSAVPGGGAADHGAVSLAASAGVVRLTTTARSSQLNCVPNTFQPSRYPVLAGGTIRRRQPVLGSLLGKFTCVSGPIFSTS